MGGGGAKKISPARGHCSIRKLRSPTNGVFDWCGSAPPVNCQSPVKFFRFACAGKNSVDSCVVSFDSALDESM